MATFESVVESANGRSNAWSQAPLVAGNTFQGGGICGPLAAKWLRDTKLVINFKQDMTRDEAVMEVLDLKVKQTAANANWVADYLWNYGFTYIATDRFPELPLGQLLTTATTGQVYSFIGITSIGVDGAPALGHAFAIKTRGTPRFFDPNFGQAAFDNVDDLKRAFTVWYRLQYMQLRGNSFVDRFLP